MTDQPDSRLLKVMSYNILYYTPLSWIMHPLNAWPRRKSGVLSAIVEQDCDIFGLQECMESQFAFLSEPLQEQYESYAAGSNGGMKGETCPIFWKRARFELLDQGTFWVNEGYVPLQKQMGALRRRICSWVILRDGCSGRDYRIYNTHLDHHWGTLGYELRKVGAELLLQQMKQNGLECSVLLGDMNFRHDSRAAKVLLASLNDSYCMMNPPIAKRPGTNVRRGRPGPRHIDYVYCSRDLAVRSYTIVHDTGGVGGGPASDHYPVVVSLSCPQGRGAAGR